MSKKQFETCRFDKIPDNEPIFILRGQDALAPLVVEYWAELAAKMRVPAPKILEAHRCVQEMREFEPRRLPD